MCHSLRTDQTLDSNPMSRLVVSHRLRTACSVRTPPTKNYHPGTFLNSPPRQRTRLPSAAPAGIRNYSVIQIYPDAPSASLQAAKCGVDPTETKDTLDLANDTVENWTSSTYAHLPLQPDFTLFEPIQPASQRNSVEQESIQLKSRIDTNLSERLVHLLQHDYHAAEQLKTEILKNSIELPANLHVTSHCVDFLFRHHDIRSYLEWLPLVASGHLEQVSDPNQHPPISIAEIHLNQYLKLAPHEIQSMLHFLDILIAKKCFSRHLSFAVIRHLVRTQVPATTVSLADKIFDKLRLHLSSSLDLIKSSQDFLVLQLANQGHLSDALQLFYAKQPVSGSEEVTTKVYPLLYQVLADQLLAKAEKDPSKASQQWFPELEKLISLWRMNHGASLRLWLTPDKSNYLKTHHAPPLTIEMSKKYNRVFDKVGSVTPQVCQEFSMNKLAHFTAYFRSLFDHHSHPKFIKASKLANEIHQILPLPNSFLDLQEKLGMDQIHNRDKTEEQIIKSLVLEPSASLTSDAADQLTSTSTSTSLNFQFESRSDVVFIWAHSWMIFYHRSGQPHRAVEIFLDYFMPMGCDLNLINQLLQRDSNSSNNKSLESSPLSADEHQKYQKSVHPTTGVLTVLYDSILSICPPEKITKVFDSFLTQHFYHRHRLSKPSNNSCADYKKRIEPNLGSFRPFVKAYLRNDEVDGAIEVLKTMHVNVNGRRGGVDGLEEDEGGWMDLLEWCAVHSSGPKPNHFLPSYHWGDLRRKKINRWDGKMKEELIYLVLKKFLLFKFDPLTGHLLSSSSSSSLSSVSTSTSTQDQALGIGKRKEQESFLEHSPDDLIEFKSNILNVIQESKIFRVNNFFIEQKLSFLNQSWNHIKDIDRHSDDDGDDGSWLVKKMSRNFPTLKLLFKIRFGFFLSKNSKGLKFINKLIKCYK